MRSKIRLITALLLVAALVVPVLSPTPVLAATTTLNPNAVGNATNLSLNDTTNWGACSTSDGDTSYVYRTSNDTYYTDTYNLPDPGLTGTINSVTVYIRAKRESSTMTQTSAKTVMRIDSADNFGTARQLTTNYADYSTTYTTKPGGAAWTWTDVNNLQAGVSLRRSNQYTSRYSRCTHVWVVVDYTAGPQADLRLEKDVDNATPFVGGTVTFTITVTNDGPDTTTNITVTDIVPSGYTYVAASIAGGDSRSDVGAPTLTWTIDSLTNGSHEDLTFDATVQGSGEYENCADITASDENDPNAQNDSACVSTTPVGPDIYINKTGLPNPVEAGQTIHYTYEVTNETGAGDITGVTVTDPPLSLSGPVKSGGDDDDILEDGETWTYTSTYVATMADLNAGSVTNTATATGTAPGDVPVEDTAGETVNVDPPTAEDNPALAESCGMDVVLVLDMSGSIEDKSGAEDAVKDAAKAFVDALLPATPSLIGLVEFSKGIGAGTGTATVVLNLTADADDLKSNTIGIDSLSATPSGYTNWEKALLLATGLLETDPFDRDDTEHPDLIIIITDGEPTTSESGWGVTSDPSHLYAAIIAANAAKTSASTGPIRILVVGIDPVNTDNLEDISGSNVADIISEVNAATDVVTGVLPPADPDILDLAGEMADVLKDLANVCPGTIIIEKVTDPSGGTGFAFTDNIESPNSFSLDHGQTKTFTDVEPGTYMVTEDDPMVTPGCYNLTDLVCVEDKDNNSTPDLVNRQANITLEPGETVTCTFTNTEKGTIIIQKVTDPSPDLTDRSFDFTAGGGLDPSSFLLKNGDQQDFIDIPVGTYTVTETVPDCWELTSIMCEGGDCTPITDGVTVDLDDGETVTVTFTNTYIPPKITVTKEVIGGGPMNPEDFNLHVQGQNFTDDGTGTEITLTPGAYEVTEDDYSPCYTTTFSTGCSGTAACGDVLTCNVTNTYVPPKITVTKVVDNTGGGTKTPGEFQLHVQGQNFTDDGTGTEITLTPGAYEVTEDDYSPCYTTEFSGDCSGTAACGDVLTCTVTNTFVPTELASIGDTLFYDYNGNGVQDPGEGGMAGVTVHLEKQGSWLFVASTVTDANGQYKFTGLDPGTYRVDVIDETLPAGVTQTAGKDPTDPITLSPGQDYDGADFGYQPPEAPPPYVGGVGGEVYPINKVSVLAPWLGLILILAIGGGILVLRRRRAH